ncbi:MAG: ice-binding family protein [Actinomycetota bacterium]|nr:ice-binding family protein [Actinomycetota bacterium]
MFGPIRSKRSRRAGIALVVGLACVVASVGAQASSVGLGTAQSFVVLAGSTVTNTGPSVLNGDLGLAPGTSIVGFGPPAVVNGATHAADGVAAQAQADLTTAYNAAASQPATDLSGTDLGNRSLNPGAYSFTSSAQLTGPLTLNAQGNANAQFVFEIGSTLTTASASSVVLVNGASPCNVYWQIGSSATLGTTTAFQGNLMALSSITLNNGATVIGRVLARNGAVTLINNVLDNSRCTTGPGSPSGPGPGAGTPGAGSPGASSSTAAAAAALIAAQAAQASSLTSTTTRNGTTTLQRTPHATCTSGFRATVRGKLIKRVVFSLDGKKIQSQTEGPYVVFVRALPGAHAVKARVTFKDATRAKTLALGYRACADAILRPTSGPAQFTG